MNTKKLEYDLTSVLEECKKSAENGHRYAKSTLTRLNNSLIETRDLIQEDIDNLNKRKAILPEVITVLKEQFTNIQSSFISLTNVSDNELYHLKLNLSKFTITLFGRTMAGKSTLMEILTKGDGKSIGNGSERTTRDVRTYSWNNLTIVDVPGICAYEGKEDEEIAFNAAKQADMILFLITDDGPQSDEITWFSRIVALGKPVICIINYKASIDINDDKDLIEYSINSAFNKENLDGIKKQFMDYIEAKGQEWRNLSFSYVHLLSAFLSEQCINTNPDLSIQLFELSHFESFQKTLIDYVKENGPFYRTKTFFDTVINPMLYTQETMINQSNMNRNQVKTIANKIVKLRSWGKKQESNMPQKIRNLTTMIGTELRQEVPKFTEIHYMDNDADKAWAKICKNVKIEDRCNGVIKELNDSIENELNTITHELQVEMNYNKIIYSNQALKMDRFIDGKKIWNHAFGYAELAITLATAIAQLCGAAIAGPLGWIGIGVAVIGGIGGLIIKSRNKKEKEARNKLASLLKSNIQAICDDVENTLNEKCERLLREKLDFMIDELSVIESELLKLSNIQADYAWKINSHILNMNKKLFISAFEMLNNKDEISILKVARLPGNICVAVLSEGTELSKSFKESLMMLMSEKVIFIGNNKDKMMVFFRTLNSGLVNPVSINKSNYTIDDNILYVDYNLNFDDETIKHRVILAQQLVEMIIMKRG